jgi:hypothetical protein
MGFSELEGEDVQDDCLDDSVSQAWVKTDLLAADIRQSTIGVPEIKAPVVERYMKVIVVRVEAAQFNG